MKDTAHGRFRVVGQLGRGALADVYLCRLQGVAGFEKEMVVKRIVAEYAADPLFVRMFLDEARVVAKLTHANIVQVFEAGVEDGVPYIAMEYIRGVNLAMIIARAHKDGAVHYGHCANIMSGICEGLEYAHMALDQDGEPLGIVHRDVRPANVVVSLEGVPKLLEFGMASAKGRLSQGEGGSGVFRGKLRYMAPELISQGPIDHRADVYAMGVTLFELTTGHNPFGAEGDPEVEVLDRVLSGVFPRPSQIVSDYPQELEAIILSALERDVQQRCASARDLRERLQAFMSAFPEHASNQKALAGWLRKLFPDFATMSKAGAIAGLTGPSAPELTPVTPAVRRPTQSNPAIPAIRNGGAPVPDPSGSRSFLMSQPRPAPPSLMSPPRERSRSLRWALVAAAGVAAGVVVWVVKLQEPSTTTTAAAISAAAGAPDPREAAKAYLDAAESFVSEKRYDPALDMVAKAADLKVDDPSVNVRIAHLRDKISSEAPLGKATAFRDPEPSRTAPVIDPMGSPTGSAPAASADPDTGGPNSGRAGPSARAVSTRRKARGHDGSAALAVDRRGRLDDEPMRYPPPSATAHPRRQASTAEPREESPPASGASPSLPPPPPSRPAAANPPAALPSPFPPGAHPPPAPARGTAPAVAAAPPHPASAAPAPAPRLAAAPSIPPPNLPRVYVTEDSERLARVCQQVETAAIAAGVPADFARGITIPLRRQVRPNTPIYPAAMYSFLMREAAQRHDRGSAAANLAAAHASGAIRQASGP